jgi:hypothetical protein
MIQIERPIGKADLEFYESHMVEVAAIASFGKGEAAWKAASRSSRNYHRKRGLDMVHAVVNDTRVVDRLHLLTANLQSRR